MNFPYGFMIQLLNMSFTAGCTCLIVLVLRLLFQRLPRVFSYGLWGIVIFRFLCPFTLTASVSLLPVNPQPVTGHILFEQVPAVESGARLFDRLVNGLLAKYMTADPTVSMNPLQGALYIGFAVWIIGALGVLSYYILLYIGLHRKVKGAVRLKRRIYASEKIDSPFVMGIVNPKVYLPFGLDSAEEKCILAHEWAHVHQRAGLVRIAGILTVAIHWFNPLAWVSVSFMCRDMEMACDERALKTLGFQERQQYAMMLYNVGAKRSGLAISVASGEGNIKPRLHHMRRMKKPVLWKGICGGGALALAALTLMTNPAFPVGGQEDNGSLKVYHEYRADGSSAVSIIGGADGPTSIFIAGKISPDEEDEKESEAAENLEKENENKVEGH